MSNSRSNKHTRPCNRLQSVRQKLGPVEYRPISQLKPYARNPRRHPERQLVKLTASILDFGFIVPVLLAGDGELIGGEARVEAARRAGLTHVPTICIEYLSPAQVKAFRLVENRLSELGEWDVELLAAELEEILVLDEVAIEVLGWETAEIDVMLDSADCGNAGQPDPADEAIEPPSAPVSRISDLWLLGSHRLLCGSSLDAACWERLLAGEKARMSFSDPPYNVSVTKHVCGLGKIKHAEFAMASGEMSQAEFTTFLTDALKRMADYCDDGAVLDVCMDWRHLFELLTAARAVDLTPINLCVWQKRNGGMGSLYRSQHELVLILKKGKVPHTNNVELGKHGRYRTNIWNYAGVNSFGRTRMTDLADHPTVKPVALVADAIRDVTNPGDIVIDAFVGSGTTLLAAERTRRRGYGIELEPRYIDVAIRRWQAMTGREAVLDATGDTFAETAEARFAQAAALAEPDESLPEAA